MTLGMGQWVQTVPLKLFGNDGFILLEALKLAEVLSSHTKNSLSLTARGKQGSYYGHLSKTIARCFKCTSGESWTF